MAVGAILGTVLSGLGMFAGNVFAGFVNANEEKEEAEERARQEALEAKTKARNTTLLITVAGIAVLAFVFLRKKK